MAKDCGIINTRTDNGKNIEYSQELETLIAIAVADGELTEAESQILRRKALEEGVDPKEFELVLADRMREEIIWAVDSEKVLDTQARRCIMSSQKLAKQLSEADSNCKRVTIIPDFPIPSAEEDLLEFIITMSVKAKNQGKTEEDGSDGYDEKRAYVAKYDEACLKAQPFFLGDARFYKVIRDTTLTSKDRKMGAGIVAQNIKKDLDLPAILWIIIMDGGILLAILVTIFGRIFG